MNDQKLTGYPSIDKPWLKYYADNTNSAPNGSMKKTAFEFLYDNNKSHLSDIAIMYFNKEISYKILFEKINNAAFSFLSMGINEGDIVTCLVLSQPETVYTFYALNKIGATVNFLNPLLSDKEINQSIVETNSKYIITLNLFSEKVLKLINNTNIKFVLELDLSDSLNPFFKQVFRKKLKVHNHKNNKFISWENFYKSRHSQNNRSCSNNYIITHTGGTTGIPKGVLLQNSAINGLALEYMNSLKYHRQDVFLDIVVPFVVYGIGVNIHMPLSLGLKTVLVPNADINRIGYLFHKYKPNHVISIPSYWEPILSSKYLKNENMSYLITAGAGGDGMTDDLEIKLNDFLMSHKSKAKILNGYGMTELCSTVSTCQYNAIKKGSVGIPLHGNIVGVFNLETMEELKYNQSGEICVSSPYMMKEYFKNQAETNNIKKTINGKQWIVTGDIGYIDEDGFIFIQGRSKRIILTQFDNLGHKVFPKQIENIIAEHKNIKNVCVVQQKHSERNFVPVVCAVLFDKNKQDITETELKIKCENTLSDYSRPYAYYFFDELPLTGVGKVDYRSVEKLVKDLTL